MSTDPFAKRTPKKEEPVAETPGVTVSPVGEISLSGKTGPGYEAGLINLRAPTVRDAAETLGIDPEGKLPNVLLAEVIAKWNEVHVFAQDHYRETKGEPAPSAKAAPAQRGKPAGATQAPDWMGLPPSCDHGKKRYVTKVGAKGQWHAWGCPGPKNDQCEDGLDFQNEPK